MFRRTIVFAALIASGTLLSACANAPMQNAGTVASNHDQECKIVTYGSTAQALAAYNKDMHTKPSPSTANSSVEQTEGVAGVAAAQVHNPGLRGRGTPNVMDDAQRKC